MFDHFQKRLRGDRRLAVLALVLFTAFFVLGSFVTQTAIDAGEGVFAIVGIVLMAGGLIGQLVTLATLFRPR